MFRFVPLLLLGLLLLAGAPAADPPSIAAPFRLSEGDVEQHQGVHLLGALRLQSPAGVEPQLTELSGLAWDADEQRLYAVSDRGGLFELEPVLRNGRLVDLRLLAAHPLLGENGQPLPARRSDSEGLALERGDNGVRGDSTLLISFEGPARVARYRPDGTFVADLKLPPPLADRKRYRDGNSMLESIALDLRHGPVTGVERPMKGESEARVPICALAGGCWDYPLADAPGSALTDLAPMPDGGLLTLERAFVNLFQPLIISLRRTRLPEQPGGTLAVETVARFDSSRGWMMDNFEGLAHHTGNRYFMVSDDNASMLQHTLLVYFEVLP